MRVLGWVLVLLLGGAGRVWAGPSSEVDVVVAGGTVAAVAAAVSAAEAGARVCLLAPRPYVGEDVAGELRLEVAEGDDWSHPWMAQLWGSEGAVVTNLTPIRVKKVLDEAVLGAGVEVRCWSVPSGVVRDASGHVSGVEFRSRNGVEWVAAKVVVDATREGRVAQSAGMTWERKQGGRARFRHRVLAGEAPRGEGLKVRDVGRVESVKVSGRASGAAGVPERFAAHLYECEVEVEVREDTVLGRAEAEQEVRDRVWVPSLVDAADVPVWMERAKVSGSVPYVLVPEGAETVGRSMVRGRECGQRAATVAASRGALVGVVHRERALPVVGECDVFVAGAGTAGAPAAIAAARAGLRVVVCDYAWKMGGVMTEGRIGKYWYGNRVGFTEEVDAGVGSVGWIFSEAKAEWFRRECRAAGAQILFGTMACGIVVEEGAVCGVVVATAEGVVGVVRCKTAIDSTGNSDLAAFAKARTEFIDAQELSLQGATFARQSLGASYQNSDFAFLNDTDPTDLTWMAMRGRRAGEGGWNQSQVPSSRERRRIVGAYQVTSVDEMNARTYPDVICIARSNFDSHGQTEDPLFFLKAPPHAVKTVQLPYRALLPESLDGLLVTGLGMSAERDAMPILRMQPDVQNQGYAAGLASAQAVRKGCRVREINVKELQGELIEKGILPESVLSMPDSFPVTDAALRTAVARLANHTEKEPYPGVETLAAAPERARALVREAWEAAEVGSEARFRYAVVGAYLGETFGVEEMVERLEATAWDKGWNYRGMGQFGRSVSDVDGWILMLGHVRAKEAVPAIVAKAAALEGGGTYSHYRAVALSLEQIGDQEAAPALYALLKRPGVGGHALRAEDGVPKKLGGDPERTACLRELCLARALYRLGDVDGLGEATLRQYAADPRRAYAAHAQRVLDKGR